MSTNKSSNNTIFVESVQLFRAMLAWDEDEVNSVGCAEGLAYATFRTKEQAEEFQHLITLECGPDVHAHMCDDTADGGVYRITFNPRFLSFLTSRYLHEARDRDAHALI